MVTTLHHIYHIKLYQPRRNLYQVLGIIIISTCKNYLEYLSERFQFYLLYFSLRYKSRKKNQLFSSVLTEIKPNQNKAVGIRTTHIVRQGFVCKQPFFNVLILLRFFVLFLANGFSTCKNYIEYLSQRHQFHLFYYYLSQGYEACFYLNICLLALLSFGFTSPAILLLDFQSVLPVKSNISSMKDSPYSWQVSQI